MDSYADYLAVSEMIKQFALSAFVKTQEKVQTEVSYKFPVLILINPGSLLYKRIFKDEKCSEKHHFKENSYRYFLRPGYHNFLKTLCDHPRARIGFYSSMMLDNCMPVIINILEDADLIEELEDTEVFYADHCSEMTKHPQMRKLADKAYDKYRDLDKVWETDFCKNLMFGAENTLCIDAHLTEVQLCRLNSLVPFEYTLEDVEAKDVLTQCDEFT